jgi:hypothetical protein
MGVAKKECGLHKQNVENKKLCNMSHSRMQKSAWWSNARIKMCLAFLIVLQQHHPPNPLSSISPPHHTLTNQPQYFLTILPFQTTLH